MSNALYVYFHRSLLPSVEVWTSALAEAGYPMVFDEAVDLETHIGYLPVEYDDDETGFEFMVAPLNASAPENAALPLGDRDAMAEFDWRTEDEFLVACAAAGVLARLTNGVYVDPVSDEMGTGEEAMSIVRQAHAD